MTQGGSTPAGMALWTSAYTTTTESGSHRNTGASTTMSALLATSSERWRSDGERDEPELVEGEGVEDRTAVADEDTQSGCGSVAAADEGSSG